MNGNTDENEYIRVMYCPSCGHRITSDAVFCPECGERTGFGEYETYETRWSGTDHSRKAYAFREAPETDADGQREYRDPDQGSFRLSEDAERSVYRPREERNEERNSAFRADAQTRYGTENNSRSRKNRWLALFLCAGFGLLGSHRFYTRKYGTAVLYLLTGGLFWVGVIVDFLRILFGSFTDKDGKRLS